LAAESPFLYSNEGWPHHQPKTDAFLETGRLVQNEYTYKASENTCNALQEWPKNASHESYWPTGFMKYRTFNITLLVHVI